jgi:hypothetical protein
MLTNVVVLSLLLVGTFTLGFIIAALIFFAYLRTKKNSNDANLPPTLGSSEKSASGEIDSEKGVIEMKDLGSVKRNSITQIETRSEVSSFKGSGGSVMTGSGTGTASKTSPSQIIRTNPASPNPSNRWKFVQNTSDWK